MAEELLIKSRFVSEATLEEKRKLRQEEWERVRQPDQPIECPEEEVDARSLFDRLQEQKDKKQAEYEEQFKFKNMVRGLETDEVDFLSEVSKQQELIDRRRVIEDRRAILEYRDAVVRRTSDLEKEPPERSERRPAAAKTEARARPTQTQLLAGAVKRRGSSTDELNSLKRPRGEAATTLGSATHHPGVAAVGSCSLAGGGKPVSLLPGLGAYSGSSCDDDDDDDEEENGGIPEQEES